MRTIEFLSRATDQVVQQYVDSRSNLDRPISTTEAMKAIRAVLPSCNLTDRELADMIAASAIRQGRSVAFDTAG